MAVRNAPSEPSWTWTEETRNLLACSCASAVASGCNSVLPTCLRVQACKLRRLGTYTCVKAHRVVPRITRSGLTCTAAIRPWYWIVLWSTCICWWPVVLDADLTACLFQQKEPNKLISMKQFRSAVPFPVFHLEAPTCKSNDGYPFVTALPPVCQIFMHVSVLPSLNGCSSFNGSQPGTWSQQTHAIHIFLQGTLVQKNS